jgi:hypothetical protein
MARPRANTDDSEVFSWRGDPEDNFSDWTVQVNVNKGTATAKVNFYNVHRLPLARRSRYFKEDTKERTKEKLSILALTPKESSLFPDFLDFIYDLPSFKATTDRALPLLKLAEKLQCPSMVTGMMNFILEDMRPHDFDAPVNLYKAVFHLKYAYDIGHEDVLSSAMIYCCLNFSSMQEDFLKNIEPPLFRLLINCEHLESNGNSFFIGGFICLYFRFHPGVLTWDFLLEATRLEIVPWLSKSTALGFLELIKSLDFNDIADENELDSISKLCVRCYNELDTQFESVDPIHLLEKCTGRSTPQNLSGSLFAVAQLTSALLKAQRKTLSESEKRNGVPDDEEEDLDDSSDFSDPGEGDEDDESSDGDSVLDDLTSISEDELEDILLGQSPSLAFMEEH